MIETNLILRALGFGGFRSRATVDSTARRVTVERTRWWRLEETRFDFDLIDSVAVELFELPRSFNLASFWRGPTDALESFGVVLVIRGGLREVVARFRGEGARTTGLLGALFGDSAIDFRGTQEREAVLLAEALSQQTGAPLAPHAFSPQPLGGFARQRAEARLMRRGCPNNQEPT